MDKKMKKVSGYALMLTLGLLYFSCSQIDIFQPEDFSKRIEEPTSKFLLEMYQESSIISSSVLADCASGCVEEPVFWSTDLPGFLVYNDSEKLAIKFDFSILDFIGAFELYYAIDGGPIRKSAGIINPMTTQVFEELIPLDPGFEACSTTLTLIGLDVDLDGVIDLEYSPNYGVYEICEQNGGSDEDDLEDPDPIDDDDNSGVCASGLNVDLTCNGDNYTATFTFFSEEDGEIVIQGGLTYGTSDVSGNSNVLTQNTTHPSTVRSRANVTRWEGEVSACEEVKIIINFSGGNGIGDWTAQRKGKVLGTTSPQTCN